ncbi:hypothetical protein QQ020_20200 [Fulvivirgaceae bacterium BMA12]|uniref:NHL repeat-containing protein n=1 Tax=Agaribacillus aureus TaxID=3051825 RepID=A0ABT8LDN8_9BACT|nr:hypothetical protein [Fulvivirgaceae bacterium BMA12]
MRVKKRHPFISSLLVTLLMCIFGCEDPSSKVIPSDNEYQVTTLAGGGQAGFSDGVGADAKFHNPTSLTIGPQGILYVADRDNHRIRKISPEGEVTTIAGNGETGLIDGNLPEAKFTSPQAIAFDLEGNLLIAEKTVLRKIDITDNLVNTITGKLDTFGYEDGNLAEAVFNDIKGVAVDKFNHIYVSDHLNHAIRKITTDGQVTTFAGNGTPGIENGLPQNSRFNHPQGVFMTLDGILMLADEENNLVRKINSGGVVEILAGSIYGYRDGVNDNARFRLPTAVAEDLEGNIYVADAKNFRIRIIKKSGLVETIAGSGVQGFKDAMGQESLLGKITGIAIDNAGNIYLADQSNHCIRKLIKPVDN